MATLTEIDDRGYTFETHFQPGQYWTMAEKDQVRNELRRVGEACLPIMPNYQCFSDSPSAFDDKIVIIARQEPASRIVAFTSASLLVIDDFGTVLDVGLTCVLPEQRRQAFQFRLFARLLTLICKKHPKGIWVTNISGTPSSLASIALAMTDVFPSPDVAVPQETHLRIAHAVSLHHRAHLSISDDAIFTPESFVFQNSAIPGSPWHRDITDPQYQHRHVATNDYYLAMLAQQPGNEVLQVGYVDPPKVQSLIASRYGGSI